jgi:hydroxyacylglutathione hydrolase
MLPTRIPLSILALVAVACSLAQIGPQQTNLGQQPEVRPKELGTFPDDWIYGGDCVNDPLIQVHEYNEDTYILRQSMCTNFEGPFMYLLFGSDKVMLLDTGAGGIPIAATVNEIISRWLLQEGKVSIDLIVAHTHSHGDHVQGDGQFAGQANTTVVGLSPVAVATFFDIAPWPTEQETYDLGGRVLDVFAIPGHQAASIALYDRNSGLVLTGDSLYPGYIFLSSANWNTYRASISRLRDFLETVPTSWVLGTHIEMKSTPFTAYPYGSSFQPEERVLQLKMKHLRELDDALDLLPNSTTQVHADFIING